MLTPFVWRLDAVALRPLEIPTDRELTAEELRRTFLHPWCYTCMSRDIRRLVKLGSVRYECLCLKCYEAMRVGWENAEPIVPYLKELPIYPPTPIDKDT